MLGSDDVAVRTKRVLDALIQSLVKMERPEGEAGEKVRLALAAMELSVKDDGKSEYLLFLGQREISGIASVINEKWDSIIETNSVPAEERNPEKPRSKRPRMQILI